MVESQFFRARMLGVVLMCGSAALFTFSGCTPAATPVTPTAATGTGEKGHDEHEHGHEHGDHEHGEHEHSHAGHHHAEHGPHKGTLVLLGDEEFHVEVVLDAEKGKLLAYPLDGAAEKALTLEQPEIELVYSIRTSKEKEGLPAEPKTGKLTAGKDETGMQVFTLEAEDLKGVKMFDGHFGPIKFGEKDFAETKFKFPEGNHVH